MNFSNRQSFFADVITFFTSIAYQRIFRAFLHRHAKPLPTIVVAGNIGKSTLTLLVSQRLRLAGYLVLTGTSQTKNYNTPLGILYTLYGQQSLITLLFKSLFITPQLSNNTVIVQECGVDEKDGMLRYIKIFKKVDIVLMAGLASEHSGGFSHQWTENDQKEWNRIMPSLPQHTISQFADLHDTTLRLVILEQLKIIPYAKYAVIPNRLNTLTNTAIRFTPPNPSSLITTHNTTNIHSDRYLLPSTFTIFFACLQHVEIVMGIDPISPEQLLQEVDLPYSRFSQFQTKPPFTKVIDSTYNSDPQSLSGFLDMLEMHYQEADHHILIIGEMRELGDTATVEHQKIIDRLIELRMQKPNCSYILVGNEWSLTHHDTHQFVVCKTPGKTIEYLEKYSVENTVANTTWLWCKGSQNTIFLEEVVKHFLLSKSDEQFLCRQSEQWLSIKQPYL